jgi:hypothetical protein
MWATQRLREYIIKGFTLDDDRLKQAGGALYYGRTRHRLDVVFNVICSCVPVETINTIR